MGRSRRLVQALNQTLRKVHNSHNRDLPPLRNLLFRGHRRPHERANRQNLRLPNAGPLREIQTLLRVPRPSTVQRRRVEEIIEEVDSHGEELVADSI